MKQPVIVDNELRDDTNLTMAAMLKQLTSGKVVFVGTTNERAVAQRVIEQRERLRSYQGVLYEYRPSKQHYVALSDPRLFLRRFVEELYIEQTESLKEEPEVADYADQIKPRNISGNWLADVEASLHAAVAIPSDTNIPCWLATEETELFDPQTHEIIVASRPLVPAEQKFIATQNMLINVEEFVQSGRAVSPEEADPRDWFSLHRMPVRYVEGRECPKWLEFLDRTFEGDSERIAMIQEWFGYILVPDTKFQKFLLLDGVAGAGKSVLIDVMVGLLGADAVSSIPLVAFTQRFDVYATFGKLLNVSPEESELSARIENKLKHYTGDGLVSSDRKHRDTIQFKPTARLVLTSNKRPKVSDESRGFWRRMLYLPFRVPVEEHRINRSLAEEVIREEGEGILQWSLAGLRRLMLTGEFTKSALAEEEKLEYKRESSPMMQFVDDMIVRDEGASEVVGKVYGAYLSWAKGQHEKPLNAMEFGKGLKQIIPNLEVYQYRVKGEKRKERAYIGIRLNEEDEE